MGDRVPGEVSEDILFQPATDEADEAAANRVIGHLNHEDERRSPRQRVVLHDENMHIEWDKQIIN